MKERIRQALLLLLLTAGAAPLAGPPEALAQYDCTGDLRGTVPQAPPGRPPLTFGIYPGGVAGQPAAPAPARPDDPVRILAALDELRGGARPFVVHLYLNSRNDGADAARLSEAEELVELYTSRGYGVEYVLTYRPVARAGEPDVVAFVELAREMVRRFRSNPGFKALQVTNEANVTFQPDSSDGAYPGARDALVRGVIAAGEEIRRPGPRTGMQIGFNWFYRTDPQNEQDFWTHLRDRGGPAFRAALDWVGLDAYPNTFFPPPGVSADRDGVVNGMSQLRECFMRLAEIPDTTPIHVTENGYPTDEGRSYQRQAEALEAMVRAVHDFRGDYNVTDYRWFDLRDADTSDPRFTQQYGIMRDDYTPKPAFGRYRSLIAELGAPPASPVPPPAVPLPRLSLRLLYRVGRDRGAGPCARSAVRATVDGPGRGRVRSVAFALDGRRVAADRRAPFAATVHRGHRARDRHRVDATVAVTGGRRLALSRRFRTCSSRRARRPGFAG